MIENPSLSECVGSHELENKKFIQYFVDEFHGAEGVWFPLSTLYATNAEIANCANHLLPYAYVDNIKIDEVGAHRRVIDCLSQDNQEKIGRVGLGFSPKLFKKLIAAPMVYIDKDFVHIIFQRVIEQQFLINFSLVRIRSILLSMIPSKLIQRKINFTTSSTH